MNSLLLLIGLFLIDKNKRKNKGIGYVNDLYPGASTRIFTSAAAAADFAVDSEFSGGTFQNEIEITPEGFGISRDLAERAGVEEYETTKGKLRKALTTLKRADGTLLYIEDHSKRVRRLTDRQVLKEVENNLIQTVIQEQYCDSDMAYYYTLWYIANGGKFHWKNKKDPSGEVSSYGVESSLFGRPSPGERKAYSSILTKRGEEGYYPEQFAERLPTDENYLGDVLDALQVACNKKQAIAVLRDILVKAYTADIPEEREVDKWQPEPSPVNMQFADPETEIILEDREEENLPF